MKIIIGSHGMLADGILDSLEMIVGKLNNVETITAYVDKNIDYNREIEDAVKNHDYEKEQLLVLTDLFGGSVNNEFMKHIWDYDFHLISGVNLPLLLEFAMLTEINDEIIECIMSNSINNIKYCNKINLFEDLDECFND